MCDLTLMSNRTTKVQNFIRIQQQIRAFFLANFSYCTHRQKCAKQLSFTWPESPSDWYQCEQGPCSPARLRAHTAQSCQTDN